MRKGSMFFDTLNIFFLYVILGIICLGVLSITLPKEEKKETSFFVSLNYDYTALGKKLKIILLLKNYGNNTLVLKPNIKFDRNELRLNTTLDNPIVLKPYSLKKLNLSFYLIKDAYFSNYGTKKGKIIVSFSDVISNKTISKEIPYIWELEK